MPVDPNVPYKPKGANAGRSSAILTSALVLRTSLSVTLISVDSVTTNHGITRNAATTKS